MLLALLLLGSLAAGAAPAPPPPGPHTGSRVLACYWGEEVATELTFATFQKFVLNPLGAELCGCVSAAANASGPTTLWRHAASYLDVYQPLSSYEHMVSLQADRAGRNSSSASVLRRSFLHPSSLAALHNRQRLLTHVIQAHGLLQRYDWFLFARTDLWWLAPRARPLLARALVRLAPPCLSRLLQPLPE